jgi:hypothetical protein
VSLKNDGFLLIDLPPIPPEVLDSYHDVPLDEYMAHGTRYKRFSQYKLSPAAGGEWTFELLPHRDYTAFRKFNPVAGGMRRSYEPVQVDFLPLIRHALAGLGLDRSEDWQINVHQNRSRTTAEKPAPLTPEGVHQDGHEFVLIAILSRHNVTGGLTRLWQGLNAAEPFWTGTLQPGQAVLLDDRAIAHDVTEIHPADGTEGYRDILISSFSRWREKWYGDEHDAAVLAPEEPAPTT